MRGIDLNADVGEGGAHDLALIGCISSANIACGWHAGDGATMRAALRACRDHGVAAGAHPSFPDRANFGRLPWVREALAVEADLIAQIGGLQALAAREGVALRHVKPHGALYNQAAFDPHLAQALIQAVQVCDPHLTLLALAGSPLLDWARAAGLRVRAEAFVDRAYQADGRLVPRSEPGAVLHDPAVAIAQGLRLAQSQTVMSQVGTPIDVRAESLCLHGDGATALTLAQTLSGALRDAGIEVRAG
ncbi:LamB/YcsF family protein [Inhella gelatinilytica]|uniref:LamB/YcsF family protein n=1 Tax=Inhella gelatinilytica TaxID=2795030 RepID=A0A931NC89_9BURK|nr:5-oxoprolinase subunit PxpA [Inhella gelatinilytica]MBH9551314.1 LamB/YcsF family protein [Inhella gelatinilytica]